MSENNFGADSNKVPQWGIRCRDADALKNLVCLRGEGEAPKVIYVKHFFRHEKEHKLKLLSPDLFRWGGVLPREGVGAKKFGVSLKTKEIQTFLAGCPGGARKV